MKYMFFQRALSLFSIWKMLCSPSCRGLYTEILKVTCCYRREKQKLLSDLSLEQKVLFTSRVTDVTFLDRKLHSMMRDMWATHRLSRVNAFVRMHSRPSCVVFPLLFYVILLWTPVHQDFEYRVNISVQTGVSENQLRVTVNVSFPLSVRCLKLLIKEFSVVVRLPIWITRLLAASN